MVRCYTRPMYDDAEQIVPYLAKIIESGIRTEELIDPMVYASCSVLHISSLPPDLSMTAEMALTTVSVYTYGELLVKIQWLDDGCEFELYQDRQYPLVFMVAAVLNTINELREDDNGYTN